MGADGAPVPRQNPIRSPNGRHRCLSRLRFPRSQDRPLLTLSRPEVKDVRTEQEIEALKAAAAKAPQREVFAPAWSSWRVRLGSHSNPQLPKVPELVLSRRLP